MHVPDTLNQVFMDEIEADKTADRWFKQLINARGYRADHTAEFRRDRLKEVEGTVITLWTHDRPRASAILMRTAFNYTTLCCTEHFWKTGNEQEG